MMSSTFPQFGKLEDRAYQASRISSIAQSIRRQCGQRGRIPFDPMSCAQNFGISVHLVSLPAKVAGRLLRCSAGYEIELCHSDNWHRQRFTLSHELAHLCFLSFAPALPKERGIGSRVNKIDHREERLCNRIAGELLMPRSRFRIEARKLGPSFDSIEGLSRIFDVSVGAVITRVKELAVWSMGQATWRLDLDSGILVNSGPKQFSYQRKRAARASADVRSILESRLREAEFLLSAAESAQELGRIYHGGYVVVHVRDGEVTVRRQVDGQLQAFVLV